MDTASGNEQYNPTAQNRGESNQTEHGNQDQVFKWPIEIYQLSKNGYGTVSDVRP